MPHPTPPPAVDDDPARPESRSAAAVPAPVAPASLAADVDTAEAVASPAPAAVYRVAVRALCEFTARRGDLDLRFTPSATALEGQTGHAIVAARRGPAYERELALEGRHGELLVRGRADGYDAVANRLEEVKTHRGPLEALPDNRRALHWAQAKVYGALLCRERNLPTLEVALVYFDVGTQQESVLRERCSAAQLEAEFVGHCERFVAWARQELAHRAGRDAALRAMAFPHADFRAGQRPLAEAVYRATVQRRCLLAQAPTGIGKTVGTLFPALKACSARGLDKLLYLTAKTPGRALALGALQTLRRAQPARRWPLRVLELVAREKACEYPDRACHGASCPLASGFYDRLPAARRAAVAAADDAALDKPSLRRIALAHDVCPYHLGQDLVRWADVVIGDYNHYFDGGALLHGLRVADGWRVTLLVDEAHNLVERARAMYSGEIRLSDLVAVHAAAPATLRPALARLARRWRDMDTLQHEDEAVLDELPSALQTALQAWLAAMGDHLVQHPVPEAGLLNWYFDALHLARLLDTAGDHSLIEAVRETPPVRGPTLTPALSRPAGEGDVAATEPGASTVGPGASDRQGTLLGTDDGLLAADGRDAVLRVRNIVPAPFLKPRYDVDGCTLFSATLQPEDYHRDLLGLPEDTVGLDVASPFRSEQLRVRVASGVSTRWRDREASMAPIAALIARQLAEAPGNYLAFFSSFDYLQRVARAVRRQAPALPLWQQTPAMPEAERDAFLARFVDGGHGVGFAVLGGAFGEGIDLPGDRLVGAFVVTLGLTPVSAASERLRTCLERCFGPERAGDYAYLYPGIQKVVQAAGRVIRTPQDRGTLWLVDDRFGRAKVRRLLPAWWRVGGGPPPTTGPAVSTGSGPQGLPDGVPSRHALQETAPPIAAGPSA